MVNVNRIILLLVAIVAGVQIVSGIENCGTIPITYYTFSYGIFLVSALLMLLMGVDIIEHPTAALAASTLPLGFSIGMVAVFLPAYHLAYGSLVSILYAGLAIQKLRDQAKSAMLFQILLHGLTGLVLFIMPLVLVLQSTVNPGYLGISVGTGLVAIGGMALAFLKSGKPILTKDQIYTIFPGVLLLAVFAFSVGIGSR
ncbi:MAG: hypothetical protein U9Q77_12425 [Candidatus Marinimicrobia bacterium]|nr:hypothetical protein [Candidatus Neomarinimicrobiota bacterium]